MKNQYTESIKEKMKDFSQCGENDNFNEKLLNECCCPIPPDLTSYIFNKILGFKVIYRPMEKVNYEIAFKYKGKYGKINHWKLSYRMYIDKDIEEEVFNILREVNTIFEKALLEYSEEAITQNQYSLPNYFNKYMKQISIIERNIEKIQKRIEKSKILEEQKIQELTNSGKAEKYKEINRGSFIELVYPTIEVHKKYNKKRFILREELSYTIEIFIDKYFSLLEHLLVLLFPMTLKYDSSKKYSEYLEYDWRAKIEKLSPSYNSDLDQLSEIKEVFRNRFTHGFFSREKEVNIQIPNYGMYLLWIGKKYCRGYIGVPNTLTYDIFQKVKQTFNDFINKLKHDYRLQFNIIIAEIPTFLNKSIYEDALKDDIENQNWIQDYWYEQVNMWNMDW